MHSHEISRLRLMPRLGMIAIGLLCVGAEANAAITSTDLYTLTQPAGSSLSSYIGSSPAANGQVVGVNYKLGAVLWDDTGTPILLNPSDDSSSTVYETNGLQQVGSFINSLTGGYGHAALWSGTAASIIDLHPSGYTSSESYGISGSQQVGFVNGSLTGNMTHAALWNGSAESFVDLNPTGYNVSVSNGNSDFQQVGLIIGTPTENKVHAALWNGSAESFVDLHPAGFTSYFSVAYDTSGTQQVGEITPNDSPFDRHAALWNGTAESFVDLNPVGATYSTAADTDGLFQVGTARGSFSSDHNHAMLWQGSAASAIDLHSFLPENFLYSNAFAIENNTIYGLAVDSNNLYHAVSWTIVPEPTSLSLIGIAALGLLRPRKC